MEIQCQAPHETVPICMENFKKKHNFGILEKKISSRARGVKRHERQCGYMTKTCLVEANLSFNKMLGFLCGF